jgi:hypothetical protein
LVFDKKIDWIERAIEEANDQDDLDFIESLIPWLLQTIICSKWNKILKVLIKLMLISTKQWPYQNNSIRKSKVKSLRRWQLHSWNMHRLMSYEAKNQFIFSVVENQLWKAFQNSYTII